MNSENRSQSYATLELLFSYTLYSTCT